ncbi:MAG: TM0106 family RecB-like putative nuclease [Planctomycetota bacterium]|nr:TM0106 family RecB-like putative nuclease [Planctomycetota bacterium]
MASQGFSIRPTVGHHFSSLLMCSQRAWLDYHGDPKQRAKPPNYLSKLQQEGLEHERTVCETHYPNAIQIPETGSDAERASLTIQAMQSGSPAILQAYFMQNGARGIADILELVGPSNSSPTGHLYRVGELKLATALSTSHVMQVAWYHELLQAIQGKGVDDAFFILGDMQRKDVTMSGVHDTFERCKQQLVQLQQDSNGPSAHLCRWCKSCPWRDVCVPTLASQSDVSLLPGVTRRLAQNLKMAGIQTWQQVIQLENSRLEQLGFDWRELAHIRTSSQRLAVGEAVLRYSIRSEDIRNLIAVSIEFSDGYRGADGHPLPRAIWIEAPDGPVPVSLAGDGSWTSQVNSLVSPRGAALYGATETVAFLKLLRQNDGPSIKCLDVLDLVETVVHGPIRGLELSNVLHVAEPGAAEPNNSRDRVLGLRSVINWLAGSGGCAA